MQLQEIWQTALKELKGQVSQPNYDTWLRDTVPLTYQDDQFIVGASSTFAVEWLESHLKSLITKTVLPMLGSPVSVQFTVIPDHLISPPGKKRSGSTPRFNSKYTFASFVVGAGNRMAHAASLGVVEKPGEAYNPVFLYGGVGLGKTHLLHAIGHEGTKHHLKVIYLSSEQFTNEFIYAIRERKIDEFRQKYRGADILLIDDIQFIAGKEQTQEEFFHTFNDLHSFDRQIVISSDRSPKSMPLLEDRLRSRFEWGLIADIQPPDFETRVAIVQLKASSMRITLPMEVLYYIAQKVQGNIRDLEGALNRTIAFTALQSENHRSEKIMADLDEHLASTGKQRRLSPEAISQGVAKYFRMKPEDLQGTRRDKGIVLSRHIAMYLLREEQCSLTDIGRLLGGRDHSTVMHGCEKISKELNANGTLRRQLMEIKEALYTVRP